jgi:regulatory protein
VPIDASRRAARKPKTCHERALGLLAVRMRSRHELRDRLLRAGFPPDEVAAVVERLEEVGLVDDVRFAEEYVRQAATGRLSGARAIASGLRSRGVPREIVDRTVATVASGEEGRAAELARARAGRLRGVPPATAYQRLASMLMRRGYEPGLARHSARAALGLDGPEE